MYRVYLLYHQHISIHTFLAEGDAIRKADNSVINTFQSTPSLRKATRSDTVRETARLFQSTPSLRKATLLKALHAVYFLFQSTPSLRKATEKTRQATQIGEYFNPHLPCGRRRFQILLLRNVVYFNPHLPCGRRPARPKLSSGTDSFQSTPSLRKATGDPGYDFKGSIISIHTFLAEGDITSQAFYL